MPNPILRVATLNTYDESVTIRDVFGSGGGVFQVDNAACLYRLQYGNQGEDYWTPESFIGTGGGPIPKGVTGIQFRSFLLNNPATVSAQIFQHDNPYLSLVFSGALVVTNLPRTTPIAGFPTTPTDGQVIVLNLNASFLGTEWLCVYNASTGYWDVIGGPPISAGLSNNEAANSNGLWIDLSGSGAPAPSILVPRAGDYIVRGRATGIVGAAADTIEIGIALPPTTTPNGLTVAEATNVAAGHVSLATLGVRINGLAINQEVRMKYLNVNNQSNNWLNRTLEVQPIRIQ